MTTTTSRPQAPAVTPHDLRAAARSFGIHRGHARRRGAFTAAGSVIRRLVPDLLQGHADLVQRYDVEVLAAAPELADRIANERATLTSEADPQTRTRYYPHHRTRWIGNGLTDLVLTSTELQGGGQTLVVTEANDL